MRLRFDKLAEIEEMQFDLMSPPQRYSYLLTILQGSPYGWGEENPVRADCSGTVCFALMGAFGYRIRTNADGLYKHIFTEGPNGVDALFFVTPREMHHGSRTVPTGTVTHVAGYIDNDVVLNAEEPHARIRKAENIIKWFEERGYDCVVRGLDRAAAEEISRTKSMFWGVDPQLYRLFEGI